MNTTIGPSVGRVRQVHPADSETLSDMDAPTSECRNRLVAALPGRVHLPESPGYTDSLGRVSFPDASRRHPACVVRPSTTDDVAAALRIAGETGSTVTVRGGGLSSNSVADEAVLIDLSRHMNTAVAGGDNVVVGGGATVGTMLDVLAPTGRIVPVGIAEHAGFGLIARGGVGYYTRSLGLTLDHLVEVELVLSSGDVVRLSNNSTGDEANLWWAVRGCAPPFGVITSATLRTHEVGPMWVDRMVIGLDALSTYFQVAPDVPRHTMMGAVLGYSDLVPGEPVFFVYTTCSSQDSDDIEVSRSAATTVANASRRNRPRTADPPRTG